MGPGREAAAAKNYALRLIKIRLRSEKEIRDKFKTKEYSTEAVEEVVDFLKKIKLIDDRLFAKLWVESRIKRPLGLSRLKYELKIKGVDKGLIEEAIDRVKENYDEGAAITEVVRNKVKRMKGLPAEKIKARLFGFLLRKGYSRDLVFDAIKKYGVSDED
jgi:regulatory protein